MSQPPVINEDGRCYLRAVDRRESGRHDHIMGALGYGRHKDPDLWKSIDDMICPDPTESLLGALTDQSMLESIDQR